ncbi:MAG: DUF2231 domain-containing protein [Bacteroidota bacterium]
MEFLANIHPQIVHFPIAFFILYFLFETSGIILKKEYLMKSALIILVVGVCFSLIAVLSGNQSAQNLSNTYHENFVNYKDQISLHEQFATISLWYFSVVLFLRIYLQIKKKLSGNFKYILLLLGLTGCVLIYFTGIYGGELVYKYGIGTKLFEK